MLLIREEVQEIHTLTEEKDGKKRMYLEGIFMQGVPNKNGRVYPMETLSNETNRYITEKIQKNRAYGELGHPQGPQINLDRISHIIENLKIEGKNVVGRARLTETPSGKIAQGLIESGGQLGMSSRGLGSLKKLDSGLLEVQDDFKLVTAADIVADPSAPEAYVNGVMENVEWVYDASKDEWTKAQIHESCKKIKKLSKRKLEESKLRLFKHYLDLVSKNN